VTAPFLAVEGLRVAYGGAEVLHGVDLELGADELLVVLGATGAGKTTLLRTLAGLEPARAGRVRMTGEDVTAAPPARRDVALVFQNFSLYPDWTVRRNMAFPLRAPGRKMAEPAIEKRVGWAAGVLRIEHLLDRRANRLSGGEMQRVAIGRAIVRRPRCFLMDEPLTNLDAKLREALRVELVLLRRELGTPMIYVTHDQAEALSMADRIVVLDRGRILQTGTPEEIYRRPADPTVARQLGQPAINLIPATVEGGRWIAADGTDLAPASADPPAARCLLGVRPEDLALDGGASEGRIEVVEATGPTLILAARWAGRTVHLVTGRDRAPSPGDAIRPRIDPERLLVFPVEGKG